VLREVNSSTRIRKEHALRPSGAGPVTALLATFLLATCMAVPRTLAAADWPCFRGSAAGTAVSPETDLLDEWPEGGPPLLWNAKGMGKGHGGIAIRGDTGYFLAKAWTKSKHFSTVPSQQVTADGLVAIDLRDGAIRWQVKCRGQANTTPHPRRARLRQARQQHLLLHRRRRQGVVEGRPPAGAQAGGPRFQGHDPLR